MKIEFLDSFVDKLKKQGQFISKDKPDAAIKFQNDILKKVKELKNFPFRNRKSIYFNDDQIRDLIYKSYVIVYKVDFEKKLISIFALIKQEDKIGG